MIYESKAERRNDRYADSGDEIVLNGHPFIINDFEEALTSIHHSVVWDPEQIVWTHGLQEKKRRDCSRIQEHMVGCPKVMTLYDSNR